MKSTPMNLLEIVCAAQRKERVDLKQIEQEKQQRKQMKGIVNNEVNVRVDVK